MLLAVDVGNTQTVIGIYDGPELVHMWRLTTSVEATSDEVRIKLHALFEAEGLLHAAVNGAVLASVVPALTHLWEKVCQRSFGIDPVIVSASACADLLGIEPGTFQELGADRVCDAVAAKALYGAPVIVVDFGTATNVEVVDQTGRFVGGIIAPGVESSMRALFSRASLIPAVELEDPGVAVGRNTTEAVQVGIVVGEAARIDGLVKRIATSLGCMPRVVATGGLAHRIAPLSDTIAEINLELTLQGLRLVYLAQTK